MSKAERTGKRILTYSGWHREDSIRRFLTRPQAAKLDMIDIDSCEVCCYCKEPVALIETQASKGAPKSAKFMAALARLAGIEAWSVSYEPTADEHDIVLFQIRRVQPPDPQVQVMQPAAYAYWLLALRSQHHRAAHPDIQEIP